MVMMLCMMGCKSSQTSTAVAAKHSHYTRELSDELLKRETMLVDAKMKQQTGQEAEALAIYRAILREDPDYSAALYGVSQIYAVNRLDSAIYYAEAAINADKENIWYRLWATRLYQLTGNKERLTQTWETIVKQRPTQLEYYYELSNSYLRVGNVPKAIEVLDRVEKMVGVTEEVSVQKQRLWNAIGKPNKGIKELERLAQAMPQNTKYNSMLASKYMDAHQYDKAKVYLDNLLAADPNDEYIHILRAEYYKATKQKKQMVEELKAGFANPLLDTESKLRTLYSFYDEQAWNENTQDANDLLEVIMTHNADTIHYGLLYSGVLIKQGKYADAARVIQRHLETDSSDWEVWEALIECEMSMDNNNDELMGICRRAAALFPFQMLPHYTMGTIHMIKREYADAIVALKRCEEIGVPPRYREDMMCDIYDMMAHAYNEQNQFETSNTYYSKAIALCPDKYNTLNSFAYLLAERNEQLDKALELSAKTIKAEPKNPHYLDTYAWILHKMGRDNEAAKYIRQALTLDPDNDEIKGHYNTIVK